MKLIDSIGKVLYQGGQDVIEAYRVMTCNPSEVSEEDEIKFERLLKESFTGKLLIEVDFEFEGIDSWNRPIFKQIDGDVRYGSTTALFPNKNLYPNNTKEDVIEYFKKYSKNLIYFGQKFNCEPDGRPLNVKVNIL